MWRIPAVAMYKVTAFPEVCAGQILWCPELGAII